MWSHVLISGSVCVTLFIRRWSYGTWSSVPYVDSISLIIRPQTLNSCNSTYFTILIRISRSKKKINKILEVWMRNIRNQKDKISVFIEEDLLNHEEVDFLSSNSGWFLCSANIGWRKSYCGVWESIAHLDIETDCLLSLYYCAFMSYNR